VTFLTHYVCSFSYTQLFVCICHKHVYICLMTIKLFELFNNDYYFYKLFKLTIDRLNEMVKTFNYRAYIVKINILFCACPRGRSGVFPRALFFLNNVKKKNFFPRYIVWQHMVMILCFDSSSEICDNCDNCV
jgi:hypothetical protein